MSALTLPEVEPLSALYRLIDADTLNPVVTRLLQAPLCVNSWTVTVLTDYAHDVKPNAAGVCRIAGTATTPTGEQRDWAVMLKMLKSPAGMVMPNGIVITQSMADDRQSFGYWKREVAVHQSGFLASLPHGLAAPDIYGVLDTGDQVWLWQAEAVNTVTWSWAHYREAAYRLGLWQGQYATGERALPAFDWLSHNWLRQWGDLPVAKILEMLDRFGGLELPVVRNHFSPTDIIQVRQLWAAREQHLARLAHLPQVLCHLDAYRANFFWHGNTLTLIDWEFAGIGALGEEMAAFVGATLLLDHAPMAEAPHLEAVALDGYIAGLRAVGWDGAADTVWQAYRAAMPLRYAVMSLAGICRTAMEPEYGEIWSQKMGKPLAAILAQRAAFVRFMLNRSL